MCLLVWRLIYYPKSAVLANKESRAVLCDYVNFFHEVGKYRTHEPRITD